MRTFVTVVLCCVAIFGCREESKPAARPGITTRTHPSDVRNAKVSEVITPAPQFVDHVVIGTQLGPDGMVKDESLSVPAGQPIYLTMVLRESPPGLQTSAVWMDQHKKTLSTERKQMNGAKAVTFAFNGPKVKPGRYKVVGYWGGNIATEREFEVIGSTKGPRKKG